MKKLKFSIFILIVFVIFTCMFSHVFASTKTYERTESNLQVNTSIVITESKKDAILKTPKVDENEKIYDFADLFTDAQETILFSQIKEFISIYNLDMVIVTISDNNKSSEVAYADDFYDYNNFGIGKNFDGLLLLIDMENRKVHISTSGSAISIYTDSRIDKMLDVISPYLTNRNYNLSASNFISQASKYAELGKSVPNNKIYFIGIAIVSFIITLIVILVLSYKHKTIKKATNAREYILKNSFNLLTRDDRFINTHTTKTYVPRSSGGESSTHIGSSGRSHGGGGRSF